MPCTWSRQTSSSSWATISCARISPRSRPARTSCFRVLAFDEDAQVGAGEYAFGSEGEDTADHGVAVVELENGRIRFWREYQRKGPAAVEEFLRVDGKRWQWHIGNYP